jgi:hypothetical protein
MMAIFAKNHMYPYFEIMKKHNTLPTQLVSYPKQSAQAKMYYNLVCK